MQLRFDSRKPHQLAAIENTLRVFGDQRPGAQLLTKPGMAGVWANKPLLSEDALLARVRELQAEDKSITVGDDQLAGGEQLRELRCSERKILALDERGVEREQVIRFPGFTIEMETGTGKTYVYLRSIYEMIARFGWLKFVIVVPDIAGREGALKSIEILSEHLAGLYSRPAITFRRYSSENLSAIDAFAREDTAQVLLINISSFDKESNILNQPHEVLQGSKPLHLLQGVHPVVIMDEPQRLEGDAARQAIGNLNPLCTLRYSATHRQNYNKVYRLSPQQAHEQGLVKSVTVESLELGGESTRPFLRLESIKATKKTINARMTVKVDHNGQTREKKLSVRSGDNLGEKSGRSAYDEWEITEIDAQEQTVRFTNGDRITTAMPWVIDSSMIAKATLKAAMRSVMEQHSRLKAHNIKPLGLILVDSVANYVAANALLPRLFNEIYSELLEEMGSRIDQDYWRSLDPEHVRSAYFAKDNSGTYLDDIDRSKKHRQAGEEAFHLIMRDKELLLSGENPTHFIFGHTALIEGWDNPNIFTIATLREIGSTTMRRQALGRGLRLPVNEAGEQVSREDVDEPLNMIVSESYGHFISELQNESKMAGEILSSDAARNTYREKRRLREVKVRRAALKEEALGFMAEQLSRPRELVPRFDRQELLRRAANELGSRQLSGLTLTTSRHRLGVDDAGNVQEGSLIRSEQREQLELADAIPDKNVLDLVAQDLDSQNVQIHLSRRELFEILSARDRSEWSQHPQELADEIVRTVKRLARDLASEGSRYRLGESRPEELIEFLRSLDPVRAPKDKLVPVTRSLWNQIVFDSEPEQQMAKRLEGLSDEVAFFMKIPLQWSIPTLGGQHSPDWAIVTRSKNETGFELELRESKGRDAFDRLPIDEQSKIRYARSYANALGVRYELWGRDSRRQLTQLVIPD